MSCFGSIGLCFQMSHQGENIEFMASNPAEKVFGMLGLC